MNETRKQIIELIEPYMEKELSEGCLLDIGESYFRDGGGYLGILTREPVIYKIKKDEEIERYFKIIGHYDITAVLKYLKSKKIRLLKFDGEDFIYRGKEADFLIQGKPLHLYTKQEEKDLLSLLQTIGPTNKN